MAKPKVKEGTSDKGVTEVLVTAVTDENKLKVEMLEFLHLPETVAAAYLLFGNAGRSFQLWDLNNLPEDMSVEVVVRRRGVKFASKSYFEGRQGNIADLAENRLADRTAAPDITDLSWLDVFVDGLRSKTIDFGGVGIPAAIAEKLEEAVRDGRLREVKP